MRRPTAHRRRNLGLLAGGCAVTVAIAGCSSSSGSGENAGKSGKVVDGATFSMALNSDPGNLDPQGSAANNVLQIAALAYDSLVSTSAKGRIQPQLASKWKVSGRTVSLTLNSGITCSDGSAFTAAQAADNINYVGNPKNKSPLVGAFLPAGATAKSAGSTVTITLPGPAPFILNGLASVPMVCAKGMANRKSLAKSTDGTGPYQLDRAQPNSSYVFSKRSGYTWGPAGAKTATSGMPAKIDLKVITNETTAANLMLSGQLNAGTFIGPDITRLQAAKLYSVSTATIIGETWYNHAASSPTSDPKVRQALSMATDNKQLQKVLTSGRGSGPTSFAVAPPVACRGNSVSAALPKFDLAKAKSLLEADGWVAGSDGYRRKGGKQLSVRFLYSTTFGTAGSSAAELTAAQWKKLGVKVSMKGQETTTLLSTIFSTGNWDIGWVPLNVNSPDQLIGFMSGPSAPKGNNFAGIDNATYRAEVAKAQSMSGAAGCKHWLSAESSLVKAADVIPWANQKRLTFGKGATFELIGVLQPTSIRMVS
ncbi:peptide ABC transporter substrate-binding protein [Flexivirga endophytica]|uniref:Peptide ABC transporter substrate-binding protein n=1 Tax=Flexivirga endophytica TaxID=1849103 RepID=A0A916T2A2_9MICO|nr:ABC transporter substrate-binding protein [Flexivirga endophytica]GGB29024.1 peptide ABC transporter substrate-binding protein [Flexivirga endophytica]GHB50065.1 peptide ABC transporter substrate-binding protein [Flexivirga endophytica]